jgi:hypothetical protein
MSSPFASEEFSLTFARPVIPPSEKNSANRRKRLAKAIVQQPGAQSYTRFLAGIKERIHTAQVKAALARQRGACSALLGDWTGDSGESETTKLGAKIIDRLAADLPNTKAATNRSAAPVA